MKLIEKRMGDNLKIKIFNGSLLIMIMTFFSCVSDNSEIPETKGMELSAYISGMSRTRAYQLSGKVMSGIYYLTYPSPVSERLYDIATVNFYDGTGVITALNGGDLTWQKIGGVTNDVTFYMDNVPFEENDPYATVINLVGTKQYSAGLFDYENGYNDLLWGSSSFARGEMEVSFQLMHCMAMITVEITVDASAEGSLDLDLTNSTVEITKLVQSPQSYDRTTGRFDLGERPLRSSLALVSDQIPWKEPIVTQGKTTTYNSEDFVLPPQDLEETIDRSRLKITVANPDGTYRVFSGVIPRAMTVVYEDNSTAPLNLSLLRGHKLTIRVNMNPDKMELIFLPVTVVDWVYKGTHELNGAEAGLYEAPQLVNLLEAIRTGNEELMKHYGYQNNDQWIFDIFANLTFDYDVISGSLSSSSVNFSFDFNDRSVTIKMSNGQMLILEGKEGESDLVSILKGTYVIQ